jgi:Ala-tRNA(Pro) deacylase
MSTNVIEERLTRENVGYEVIAHGRTETAAEEAAEVGISPAEVAKTVVLTTDDGFVRAVISAGDRLDVRKLRALLDTGKSARLATESELAGAYPMFELGAVPPFGGPDGDRTVVDRAIAEREWVVLEAGSHEQSVRMQTHDLLTLAKAEVADIRED